MSTHMNVAAYTTTECEDDVDSDALLLRTDTPNSDTFEHLAAAEVHGSSPVIPKRVVSLPPVARTRSGTLTPKPNLHISNQLQNRQTIEVGKNQDEAAAQRRRRQQLKEATELYIAEVELRQREIQTRKSHESRQLTFSRVAEPPLQEHEKRKGRSLLEGFKESFFVARK